VNGKLCRIHRNAEDALRRLRALPETQRGMKYWIDALCIYSHRTAMKHLRTLRFEPQFFEGVNFTHLASRIGQYILPCFQIGNLSCISFDAHLRSRIGQYRLRVLNWKSMNTSLLPSRRLITSSSQYDYVSLLPKLRESRLPPVWDSTA
jgi:hypothetical protein